MTVKTKKMILEFTFRLISKDNFKCFNKRGQFFLSKEYKDFENRIALFTKQQYKGSVLSGNLKVHINAYYKSKVHPDLFNLPKSCCDALNGIIYKDDRQIKIGSIEVFEGCPDERFTIEITELK